MGIKEEGRLFFPGFCHYFSLSFFLLIKNSIVFTHQREPIQIKVKANPPTAIIMKLGQAVGAVLKEDPSEGGSEFTG